MCNIFGSPKAPEIKYVGPSQEELDANQLKIDNFIENSRIANEKLEKSLQAQIDTANTNAQTLRDSLAADRAAAAAQLANMPINNPTYSVTTTQSDPVNAQVTESIKKKKKDDNKGTLKVAQGGTANTAGSTLNLGV
jgi:DNA polymerase III gamma/tau subunit